MPTVRDQSLSETNCAVRSHQSSSR